MEQTFDFLKKLKKNNDREWFEKNKNLYLAAKSEFEQFVESLVPGIHKFDKQISPDLKAKDCTFRIYKDVRFSKDKSPYKTNMGAVFNPGGKKTAVAGYYLHLEPGNSFFGGGVYMPEADKLNAIRQEIDYHPKEFLKCLKAAPFKKYFDGLSEEDKLKNPPKGFDKEHPLVEILKNKHFIVSHAIHDKQLLDKKNAAYILEGFKAMHPLMLFLRRASEV